jgi:transposase
MAYQRVEVISGVGRRRRYSDEEKQRLVAEAFQPGVVVVDYARQQGLCPSLLHRWRRQAHRPPATEMPSRATFVPVTLVAEATASEPVKAGPGGGRCVRVDRDVDADALRRVLQVLAAR